ncbi:hypothetical protein [Actinacidiphila bryophytorum]|uniref:Uncharacterized protein n=1 Tax=Actinacidiphila bryophytorum TaxID=1436133 RepID=A0A9W4GZI6_9ACTN|nr:hypothetical protein [Actinacidiphila bryophytorum]MBM9436130.1 hypothetical protein [Actinacidiphila bryophytorum]MBN6547377.1 hypothetical protein [Actinacidiphila bryophytorum]CAG7633978.1 conserved hypothetical protein [Actinacidiphila bryophytorum]
MSASPLVLPPVRLLSPDELARLALAVPLLDRAVRLARWAAPERDVDAMGELLDADLVAAAGELGLAGDDEDGLGDTAQAWAVAVDTGLVELEIEEEAEESTPPGEAAGRAVPGGAYERVTAGDPQDVLDVWLAAAEAALAEAASPDLEQLQEAMGEEPEWDPEEEAEFLDTALANLYTLMALDDGTETAQGAVPLPVLAASLVVPEDMEQPSDEVLEEVTEVMMRLDDHFRLLAPAGLLDYQPVDEALIEEDEEPGQAVPGGELDPEEISRYGMVRLTPLGVHGLRELLMDAGASAPLVGDLAEATGTELLDALAGYPDHAARTEAELWLADRKPADAARELLAAARGDDAGAPSRRLMCQQTLTLVGAEAEPALREVLDDRQLGGMARVWLTESGAPDVPTPDADMIFWLTIDTLAAQLAADDDPELLSDLVRDLVARHDGFFDAAWRVEHPATADVLEAMGRLHPDRKAAKDARKAAFKARSRDGS